MQKSSIVTNQHASRDGRLVISLCDKNLLGKTFSEGNAQLDLAASFYQGEELPAERVLRLISRSSIVHAVGKQSIATLKAAGYEVTSMTVDGVPHAQLILI